MIFGDSSYFIGLANKKDQWHPRAFELSKNLSETILISDFVISETVTSIGSLGGGKAGMKVYYSLYDNYKIVWVSENLLNRAMSIYLKYDGNLSLTDAISVRIMHDKGVEKIISFDADFDRVDGILRVK